MAGDSDGGSTLQQTRVVVQDRRRFVREGLASILGAEPDLDVVATADDGAALIRACRRFRPDAIVMELDPGSWDALRVAATLRRQQRTLRVVGIYRSLSAELAQRCAAVPIHAAVEHTSGSNGIIDALRQSRPLPVLSYMPDQPAADGELVIDLTSRERQVLSLIAAGNTAAETADALGISPKTVENRKQQIFAKLGVQNQAHAVAIALRSGLLEPKLSASNE